MKYLIAFLINSIAAWLCIFYSCEAYTHSHPFVAVFGFLMGILNFGCAYINFRNWKEC